jgi:hypothetical protein
MCGLSLGAIKNQLLSNLFFVDFLVEVWGDENAPIN